MTRRTLILLIPTSLLLVMAGCFVAFNKPRPSSNPTAEADAVAHQVEAAVNRTAWDQTGAVTWVFRGTNRHLWDRTRQFDRVIWGEGAGQIEAQVNLSAPDKGVVLKGGDRLSPEGAAKYLQKAYAAWINDSFWLNPLVKLFDEGTKRTLLEPINGQQRLLLQYMSGGLTPGDSYLYTLDSTNTPTAWEMWVSVLPLGGIRATWEGWTTLYSGARVATRHSLGPLSIDLTDVKAAPTAAELNGGNDPFQTLVTELGAAAP